MGDCDCSKGFYDYEVEGDCGGCENSHDQNLGRFESYSFEGENEVNKLPSAYSGLEDNVGSRDGSYDDVEACEESYISHSEPRFGVRYSPFIHKDYEGYNESAREVCEVLYSLPFSTSYQGQYSVNGYTSSSGGCPMRRRGYASPKPRGTRVPYNVELIRSVHSRKVTICGILGYLIELIYRYNRNYIFPSMATWGCLTTWADYLGLFEPLLIQYFLDEFKVTERV